MQNLKEKIINANLAYRSGTAIISDEEYDFLLEEYSKHVSADEFIKFKNTLHEVSGKVKHPFIMGSLDKVKADDSESLLKFISKYIKNKLNISAKVDGISCRLHYENGKLISGTTRGDGTWGVDLGDKIKLIKNIPHTINANETLDIRGELVILNSDFELYFKDKFANARNTVAGLINRKEYFDEDIEQISFICYTILGTKYTKAEQFDLLNSLGFYTTYNENLNYNCTNVNTDNINDVINKLTEVAKIDYGYTADGLVICDDTYYNEAEYRPDACVAFKINQQIAVTKLIDIAFEGPSENGYFIPVAILEPVEIGGVIVQRCTLHNLDFIKEKNIKYGCKVTILRSGDVIPKLLSVVETDEFAADVEYIETCPSCNSKLILDGVNYRCTNKNCKKQIIHQIAHFIKKLGVKTASEKTIENLNIFSFDDLLKFTPKEKYKSQIKFYDELKLKVFTRSKQELLAATNFNGLSEILINKIVDFYGLENIENDYYSIELPNGIGEITLLKFQNDIKANLDIVNKIISDSRYSYSRNVLDNAKKVPIIGSVCFTGKLYTMSRNEASKLAINAGYEVKSGVTSNLTYLVTNDTNTSSSKNKKAKELKIKILTEEQFLQLVKSDVENEIGDL